MGGPLKSKRARIIRNVIAVVSFVCAAVFAISANFSVFVQRELYNTKAFEQHTKNLIANPDVRESIANAITDQIVTQVPQLDPFSGVVSTGVAAVVGTTEFRDVFDRALSSVQEQIVAGNDVITLDLGAAAGPVVRELTSGIPFASVVLDNVLPAIQGVLTITVLTRDQAPQLWTWVERGANANTWSIALTLMFLVLGIAIITRHWIGVALGGGAIIVAAIGSFVSSWGAQSALRSQFAPGLEQNTFAAVYREFAGAYTSQTFVLLILGIIGLVTGLVVELVLVQMRHRHAHAGSGSQAAAPHPTPVATTPAPSASAPAASSSVAPTAPPTAPPSASGPPAGPPLLDE